MIHHFLQCNHCLFVYRFCRALVHSGFDKTTLAKCFKRDPGYFSDIKIIDCCVFPPAFGCCAHPEAVQNTFFTVFNLFLVDFRRFPVIRVYKMRVKIHNLIQYNDICKWTTATSVPKRCCPPY